MKTNEELRKTPNLLISRTGIDGGMGVLYRAGKEYGSVIWSNGGGWEHVSVSPFKKSHTPTWDEMCRRLLRRLTVMAYQRKTRDVWRLWVNYGQGYELELEEFTRAEAQQRLKEYRENCPQYPCYISKGRERIENNGRIGD